MMLRTDRRLGFDPTRAWDLQIRAVRQHGMFRPETGTKDFISSHTAPAEFFNRPEVRANRPVWVETALARALDLGVLLLFLTALVLVLARALRKIAIAPGFKTARLVVLAFVTIFIGWWGQGQLSIVTVTGVLRTALDGASFEFLLYDPFSLVIWGVVLASLVVWGRGLFCGWLCPYGALQEIAHAIGRALHLPEIRVPQTWDRRLKLVKYGVLTMLIGAAIWAPAWNDTLAERLPPALTVSGSTHSMPRSGSCWG